MALTGKITIEVTVKTSAAKFLDLFANQLHHIQNVCEKVHESKLHQGRDWHHTGSVKNWTYVIDGKVTTCKESIESIDKENKSITFKLFDGDVSKQYKDLKITLQTLDKNDGSGAIVKWTIVYEKINESVEAPYGYMEYFDKCNIDIDAHLQKA